MGNRREMKDDLLDDLLDGRVTNYDRVSRILRAARASGGRDELSGLDAALAVFAASAAGLGPITQAGPTPDDKRHWFRERFGKLLTAVSFSGKLVGGAVVAAAACGVVAVSASEHHTPSPSRSPSPAVTHPTTRAGDSGRPPFAPDRRASTPMPGIPAAPSSFRATSAAPPGHAKKSKDGKPVPPGQAKKSKAGKPAPPGQVKKSKAGKPTPPGHAKKSKASKPAPPGQAKKSKAGKPAPPGHVKKSKDGKPTPPGHLKKSRAAVSRR
jgi:hypothetical protein